MLGKPASLQAAMRLLRPKILSATKTEGAHQENAQWHIRGAEGIPMQELPETTGIESRLAATHEGGAQQASERGVLLQQMREAVSK